LGELGMAWAEKASLVNNIRLGQEYIEIARKYYEEADQCKMNQLSDDPE
jgi:hypothetical protein